MRLRFIFALLFLAACADRHVAPIVPAAASVGAVQKVFIATNRLEDGSNFGIDRAMATKLLRLDVSVPPQREPGSIADGLAKPNPRVHFAIAQQKELQGWDEMKAELNRDLRAAKSPDGRDITVYVHEFNNSFSDAAFRMAQLSHDMNITGPVVSFSWPSRAHLLGYEYDTDSILFSRDALTELLKFLDKSEARSITLVAHSLGSALVMESLRQIEQIEPGWSSKALSGVLLISPDINPDVFRSQGMAFAKWPQPFVIFSSQKDRVLRLSARIRGQTHRLGNLEDIEELAELPISFVDVSALSDGRDGNHFTAGSSKAFLELVNSSGQLGEAFLRGRTGVNGSLLGTGRQIGNAVEHELLLPTR